jgi:hypothetical protein
MATGKNAKSFYFGGGTKSKRKSSAPHGGNNSYESGIVTDQHGVPFRTSDGKVLRQKALNDGGSATRDQMRRARSSKFL